MYVNNIFLFFKNYFYINTLKNDLKYIKYIKF